MASYPQLRWVRATQSGGKEIVVQSTLPTSGGEYGETVIDDLARPVHYWQFTLKFASENKLDEVKALIDDRNSTYNLIDSLGDHYVLRPMKYQATRVEGTELCDITLDAMEEPEAP